MLASAALQPVGLIPRNRLPQPGIERRSRSEAELALGAAHVKTPARLSVGLGGIPGDPPLRDEAK